MESEYLFDKKPLVDNSEENKTNYVDKLKGFTGVTIAILSSVFSYTSVQLLKRAIPDYELNSIRFAVGSICFLPLILIQGISLKVPREEILGTIGYGFFLLLETMCLYVSATFIPVSHLEAIKMTAAILVGLVLFSVFWNEKLTTSRVCFALLCVVGVLGVTQPDFIFPHSVMISTNSSFHHHVNSSLSNPTVEVDNNSHDYGLINMGTVIGYSLSIAAGLSLSGYSLVFKRNPYVGQNILQVSFWAFICSALASTVIMAFVETPVLPETWYQLSLVAIHSLASVCNSTLYMCGLRYISANTCNILCCTEVVVLLLPQYTILSSIYPGHRNWVEVVGVVLVLLGSGMGSFLELFQTKSNSIK